MVKIKGWFSGLKYLVELTPYKRCIAVALIVFAILGKIILAQGKDLSSLRSERSNFQEERRKEIIARTDTFNLILRTLNNNWEIRYNNLAEEQNKYIKDELEKFRTTRKEAEKVIKKNK